MADMTDDLTPSSHGLSAAAAGLSRDVLRTRLDHMRAAYLSDDSFSKNAAIEVGIATIEQFVTARDGAPSWAAAAGKSREVDKRMHCQSCGTVTEDGECDCTRTDAADAQELKPYVESILADLVRLAITEREDDRPAVANALEWCIEELRRSRLHPAAAAEAPGAEEVIPSKDAPHD